MKAIPSIPVTLIYQNKPWASQCNGVVYRRLIEALRFKYRFETLLSPRRLHSLCL